MNQVFYRKYRPQKFSEFIGQENIVKTLTNAIKKGMISHAYLFSGPRGSGKTTLARLFAKAINCEKRKEGEAEPCNECQACREINEGKSLDLIEIDAASHRGIDEVRELREGAKFVPSRLKYKIFILDEAHQLSKDAANALLKILEEPPKHVIFILATTEVHKIIPTIASRCQRFDFKRLNISEIVRKLEFICQKEGIKTENGVLELVAQNAEGSMRDAESILDQLFTIFGQDREITLNEVKLFLGTVESELIFQMADFLVNKDLRSAVNFLTEIYEKGIDMKEFVKSLIDHFRKMLILKIVQENKNIFSSELTEDQFLKLKAQTKNLTEEKLRKILTILISAENKMNYSSIIQLPLELAFSEIFQLLEEK